MSQKTEPERLLRWYPPAWRERFGDELAAMIEDTEGGSHLSLRFRLSIVRAGVAQRLASAGLVGDQVSRPERLRAGSLLVLGAWAVFVIAGCGFAKFSEHWQGMTPPGAQSVPTASFDFVQIAAVVVAGIIVIGAIVVAPMFSRFIRAGGWPEIRSHVRRAAIVSAVTVAATVGVVLWTGHLSQQQRNDGLWPYALVVALWAILVAAMVGAWVVAAASAIRHLSLSVTIARVEGSLAVAVCVAMVAMTAATAVWWGTVASAAPGFFRTGPLWTSGSPWAPPMILASGLMFLATAAAVFGSARIYRSWSGRPTSECH
ncbi:MAG TPA: hypothetical protein VIX85_09180 [Acidimicrobiales bacterium]